MTRQLTKTEIKRLFRDEILPLLDQTDKPAVHESFNNFTDQLCKDGRITQRTYDTIIWR